jgi:hypothetical protein
LQMMVRSPTSRTYSATAAALATQMWVRYRTKTKNKE